MKISSVLLNSVGLLALASPAFAQAAPADDNVARMETVVVTGTAKSRQDALDQKREDDRLIEALGVDELGQLPDKNVGESLNRLPGVTMLVEKGEGRYVQIRGVAANLNNVTINGVQMGSPEAELGGRQAPLDIISGGVLSRVQVIKTPTPDMDAQGIGGTVNVDTAMPFDRDDDFYGNVTGRVGYESVRPEGNAYGGHDPYALDATVSGKVNDTFGWLLGATWSDREYVTTGVYQDDWTEVPSSPGTFLPVNVKNNYYVIGRERINFNGALEWRPTDTASYFLRGFYGSWDEYQHRNRYEQNLSSSKVTMTSDNTGTQAADRILANVRLEQADKTVESIATGGENIFDKLTIDYLAQLNHNEISEPNDNWEWRSSTTAVGPSTFVVGGNGVVTITPDAGSPDRTDPTLLPLRRVRFFDQNMQEDAKIAQFNATYDYSEALTLKAGAKFARTERSLDAEQTEYAPAGSPTLNLGSDPSLSQGGFLNDTGSGNVPNIWLDIDAMNRYFAANPGRFALNTASTFTAGRASDYDLTEDILAGYVMATLEHGPLQTIGGVRVEATNVDSSGYLLQGSASADRVNSGGDYTEVLPALLVNYRPDDAWVIRGAITRAMGRPGYDAIAPRSTYGENGAIGTLSIGNPDLVARKSWNYDASVEWYPTPLTALSVSLFYKDISDELTSDTVSYSTQTDMQSALAARGISGIDTSGLTRLDVSTTINAGSATLKGLELNAQTQFSFLPGWLDGLGASATLTLVDGEVKLADGTTAPLEGQAEQTYAFTAFYQKGPFDLSASYAYNDSYLTDNNADPNFRLDQGSFGRWDAKASYAINDRFKIFAEGVNLNNEPTTEFQGGNEAYNTEYEYVGRTFYIGASVGF